MDVSRDYEDLFKTLNDYNVRYLVVGGYAVIYYTEPRYTKDIDVWIIPEKNDCKVVYEAIGKFGAPLTDMSPEDFNNKETVYQIGIAPVRVDIMSDLPGVSFERAWNNRKRVKYGGTPINVIGIEELIKSKKKANRPQDKLDVSKLQGRMKMRRKKRQEK